MSCVVSLSVKKYKPSWTTYSSGRHDITYVHGVPGILAAVTGIKYLCFILIFRKQ